MRFLVLFLAAAMCPLISAAQAEFAAGTYELADGTKGTGKLDYQTGAHPKLVIKDDAADPTSKAGKKGQSYSPEQVRSFDIGSDHYVMLHNIKLNMPMTMSMTKKNDFAKVVETGKLELLEYQMSYYVRGHFGALGNMDNSTVYLLRRQGEDTAEMVPFMGKKHAEVMTSFLAGRPDLIKRADKKSRSIPEFRALIQEYNAVK